MESKIGTLNKSGRKSANTAPVILILITFLVAQGPIKAGLALEPLYISQDSNGFNGLIQASDGNFYGARPANAGITVGSIFKMTADGTLTTLYAFDNGANGGDPEGGLLQIEDGSLYGTTFSGGAYGKGTVFQITTAGALNTVHSFTGADGNGPAYGLVQGSDANLYGITKGGTSSGTATVFQVTMSGTLTNLITLKSTRPSESLVPGPDGNLYGTANTTDIYGFPLIYQLTTNGGWHSIYAFSSGASELLGGGLTPGNDGFLYGRTVPNSPFLSGRVFKITTNGVLTTVFSFQGTNGAWPQARLVLANDGAFYGSTLMGGLSNKGTIFRVTTNGVLTTLVHLANSHGVTSVAHLMQGNDGNLYGTGLFGSLGVIFRLVQPPVVTIRSASDNGSITLTWNSFTNGGYRVECKASPDAADWVPAGPDVTATGNTASYTEEISNSTSRWYRVLLLP